MFLSFSCNSYCLLRVFSTFILLIYTLTTITPLYSIESHYLGWNFKDEIESIIRPIRKLNASSSLDEIAKAAANFKSKIDKVYYTGYSTDQIFDMVKARIAESGVKMKSSALNHLLKRIKHYEKHPHKTYLEIADQEEIENFIELDDIECSKSTQNIEMPPQACIGCVEVFCGCLICILPGCAPYGLPIIAAGVTTILNAYAEENQKKRLWIEGYKEMFPEEIFNPNYNY